MTVSKGLELARHDFEHSLIDVHTMKQIDHGVKVSAR
jgi:hypothetical protein